MPIIELTTNVKVDDVKALVVEITHFIAKTFEKRVELILVNFTYNELLAFGATFDPAYHLSVTSLGNFSPEKNVNYSKVTSEFFQEKLGVPNHRGFISFIDPGPAYIGLNSTTIEDMFSTKN